MYRGNREGGSSGGRFGGGGGGFRGGGGGGRFQGGSFAPVKVGEELDVTIEAVGEKGDGIAKKNGFVLFIPGVKQGDQVKVRVTKVLRKVGFAEVVGQGSAPAEGSESGEAPAEGNTESSEEAPAENSESFGEEQ
ncbi:MAG: TRAM domain-containing protein [Nanoarchaeota archaeon]